MQAKCTLAGIGQAILSPDVPGWFSVSERFPHDNLTGVINNNTYLGVVPENFTAQLVALPVQDTF